MTTKTITITKDAYDSLKRMKEKNESFSKTIKRLTQKKSLSKFIGILSEKSAQKLEKTIKEKRKKHKILREKRMKRIVEELEGESGSS